MTKLNPGQLKRALSVLEELDQIEWAYTWVAERRLTLERPLQYEEPYVRELIKHLTRDAKDEIASIIQTGLWNVAREKLAALNEMDVDVSELEAKLEGWKNKPRVVLR
jgi:hypothetical protein